MKVFHIISVITILILLLGVAAGDISVWALIGLVFLYIVISAFLSAGKQQKEKEKREKNQKELLNSLEGYQPSKKTYKSDGIIAIDENNKEVAVQKKGGEVKRFNFEDIISCEVVEVDFQRHNSLLTSFVPKMLCPILDKGKVTVSAKYLTLRV